VRLCHEFFLWQSITTMPDNSVPLLTPQTLLNIAVLVAQHEASLWHDRIPSHSEVWPAASMPRNFYLLEKIEKIDALLLRLNTLLT